METEETQEALIQFKNNTIERISEKLIMEIRDHNKVNSDWPINLDDVVSYLCVDYDNPQKIDY